MMQILGLPDHKAGKRSSALRPSQRLDHKPPAAMSVCSFLMCLSPSDLGLVPSTSAGTHICQLSLLLFILPSSHPSFIVGTSFLGYKTLGHIGTRDLLRVSPSLHMCFGG